MIHRAHCREEHIEVTPNLDLISICNVVATTPNNAFTDTLLPEIVDDQMSRDPEPVVAMDDSQHIETTDLKKGVSTDSKSSMKNNGQIYLFTIMILFCLFCGYRNYTQSRIRQQELENLKLEPERTEEEFKRQEEEFKREKEWAAQREAEDLQREQERDAEDSQVKAKRDEEDLNRNKEDLELEAKREKKDRELEAKREKEDLELEAKREKEDRELEAQRKAESGGTEEQTSTGTQNVEVVMPMKIPGSYQENLRMCRSQKRKASDLRAFPKSQNNRTHQPPPWASPHEVDAWDEPACPVGLTLMKDPVILLDGHTYDRDMLIECANTANEDQKKRNVFVSPNSKLEVPFIVIPDLTLRRLAEAKLEEHKAVWARGEGKWLADPPKSEKHEEENIGTPKSEKHEKENIGTLDKN